MVGTKFTKSIIFLRDNIINLMTKACWEQTRRTKTATLQEEQREQKMNGEERKRQIKRQRKRNNIEVRRQIIRGTERWPEKTGRVVLQGTGLIHWRWCSCLVFQESRNSNMQFFFLEKGSNWLFCHTCSHHYNHHGKSSHHRLQFHLQHHWHIMTFWWKYALL